MSKKGKRKKRPRNVDNIKQSKKRDNYTCQLCGDTNNITTHHILPRNNHGDESLENLITLCSFCHNVVTDLYRQHRLGPKNFHEFVRILKEGGEWDG